MPIQRPSISKALIQMELNRFYEKPVTRVSAALVLSILCIGFFGMFAIRPTLQTMTELIKEIEEKKEIDQKLTQKIAALTVAQRELSQKESSFSLLDIAIPSSPKFTELLKAIEKVSAEKQVIFVSANVPEVPVERVNPVPTSPTNKKEELESIPLTLNFDGNYEQLVLTLRELQNLQRILIVDHYEISPAQKEETETLSLTVSVRAFAFTTTPKLKTTSKTGT